MTFYVGGGFVSEGATGYEDGDDVVDYDLYDWEFDYPLEPEPKPKPRGPKGEKIGRRPERTREHPQFAKRYAEVLDVDKLREALEWLVSRTTTPGAVRWDDIYDRNGEVAGVAFWIGFGPDVTAGAIHDGLLEAFGQAGADIAQTLIGAGNLRRGLEREGGVIKQSFFRVFLPHEGWKLLQDWTILREGESKADVKPELQSMVRERQRARRLEIIETLKDIRVAEVSARALAEERARREAAEQERDRLAEELRRQDAELVRAVQTPPVRWRAVAERAVEQARERLERPVEPRPGPPLGWRVAAARAMGRAAQETAQRAQQRSAAPRVVAPPAPPVRWREVAKRAAERRKGASAK